MQFGATLHPKPLTPHPKPETLKPKPLTLNPKPYTLNPKPETLNPEPETPWTLDCACDLGFRALASRLSARSYLGFCQFARSEVSCSLHRRLAVVGVA